MTYEAYRNVFMIAAIACGVMAAVSIILFIKLKIPAVIGDLTGATARKGIEAIRTGNIESGNKKFGSSKVNLQRGRLTAKMTPSGNLQQPATGKGFGLNTAKLKVNETTVLNQGAVNETMVLNQSGINETTVLNQGAVNETTVLNQQQMNETTVLNQSQVNETTVSNQSQVNETMVQNQGAANETTVLKQPQNQGAANETTVLSQTQYVQTVGSGQPQNILFEVLQNITLIHTEEMIGK